MDKNWDKAHHALSPFDFLCYSEHLTISFIVLIAMLATFVVTKFELSFAFLFLILLLCSKIYNHDLARLKRRFKVNAPSAKLDAESVEWFNLFLAKFWLMYEPGLSEMLKDIIDSVLDISKPSFLDQLRLTKFTLGSQGPRIDAIKTYKSESDTLVIAAYLDYGLASPVCAH
jgi:Ca2+-dependent lipid-binding protein